MKLHLSSLLVLLCLSISAYGQEVCNNGVDDDGDGLIDINDPDCVCPESVPSGLIPNPSFEDMLCCPSFEAQFECAVDWEQASAATSDYLHDCGTFTYPTWLGNDYRTPTPVPDGNGWVGFRDGNTNRPNYKEYVGACLNATMEVGKTYRLNFYLGFPARNTFNGFDLTFFAHESCDALPFGNGNDLIGCPINTPGWTQLYQNRFTGNDEWINIEVEFTADKPYNVFVLGPGCEIHEDWAAQPYFFVDRLALAETNDFDVPFASIEGNACGDEIIISAEDDAQYTYQWYLDGVALVGETNPVLDIDVNEDAEGEYVVVFGVGSTCFVSETYNLELPETDVEYVENICEGDTLFLGDQIFTEENVYQFISFSSLGCDSVTIVNLTVDPSYSEETFETICEGEFYPFNGQQLSSPGRYEMPGQTTKGCDSLTILNLNVLSIFDVDIFPTICEGEVFPFAGEELTSTNFYPFVFESADGCDSIINVNLTVLEDIETNISASICEGDGYMIEGDNLTTGGPYTYNLSSTNGCDSIVNLILEVRENTTGSYLGAICNGEDFEYLGESYNQEGEYEVLTTNQAGCDSMILLTLEVVDRSTGIEVDPIYEVSLGDEITIDPNYVDPDLAVTWTIDNDIQLDQNGNSVTLQPLINSTLTINGSDELGCGDTEVVQLVVNRDIGIYVPNIFSPNGDNNNDNWRITTSKSIDRLEKITLYDRWGNMVYVEENIIDLNNYIGWDGNFSGQTAEQGVYVYYAEFTALDGLPEVVAGDVTLVR